MVISGLVCAISPQEVLVVVEQDSHRVKAGLRQLNPTLPLDTDACMVGSDVSLAEYLCTHVALFMFLQQRLRSYSVFVDFDK